MEIKKETKKLSTKNTKEEMLSAYNELLKVMQERQESAMKPEKKLEEKKIAETVKIAESLTAEGVVRELGSVKIDIGKTLTQISDTLEAQVIRLNALQNAISAKEKELQELYEIEKSAMSLAALIEAQNMKRDDFLAEMERKKEALSQEMEATHEAWEKEKDEHEAATKERDAVEKKRQIREKEEFDYAFKKEQQQLKDKAAYENNKLDMEIKSKKEVVEKELKSREQSIAEKEDELIELRKRAAAFPKELEVAVNKAVKDSAERILLEAKNKEDLLKKQFEGEHNVFKARSESLEKTVKEQNERITILSQQLEAAYQKVQDIAVKTVEGASNFKSFSGIQQILGDQLRKQSAEK
jgi:hypothetical protein